jgi:hypothetical protein
MLTLFRLLGKDVMKSSCGVRGEVVILHGSKGLDEDEYECGSSSYCYW